MLVTSTSAVFQWYQMVTNRIWRLEFFVRFSMAYQMIRLKNAFWTEFSQQIITKKFQFTICGDLNSDLWLNIEYKCGVKRVLWPKIPKADLELFVKQKFFFCFLFSRHLKFQQLKQVRIFTQNFFFPFASFVCGWHWL